jgi:outer membrane receptor protein involved in Fe transport
VAPHSDHTQRLPFCRQPKAAARAKGLDLGGSITYADSIIKENAGFLVFPADTIGMRQPNIPKWRAIALASYRSSPQWTTSLAARYSGQQFRTLNNSDVKRLHPSEGQQVLHRGPAGALPADQADRGRIRHRQLE